MQSPTIVLSLWQYHHLLEVKHNCNWCTIGGSSARGKSRGGGTAASVAVPRRSAWIAGTASGNQAVSTHEEDGASSRSPHRPAHSRSPSCQCFPVVGVSLVYKLTTTTLHCLEKYLKKT